MSRNRNVSWFGGTLMILSTVLSIADAAPGSQSRMAEVDTFVASNATQVNVRATPAQDKQIGLVFPMVFKKKAQLDALIQAQQNPTSPEYHHFLTPEQIGQRFGADTSDLRAIVQYARSQGFTVTHVWPNRLFVSATANVSQVEKAFHIQLLGYNRPKALLQPGDPTTFFAPDRNATIPADIANRISGIAGLTNALLPRPAFHRKPVREISGMGMPAAQQVPANRQETHVKGHPNTNFSKPLTPAQISKVYNLDGLHTLGANGTGMSIAIFSPTQFFTSDVTTFANNYGISGYTVNEKWDATDGRESDFNGAGEAALDCEVIIGQANKANVTLYETVGNTTSGILDSWNQIATDGAPAVSCSWGYIESQFTSSLSFITQWDTILQTMAAAGQSIFVASGDAGAEDGNGAVGISYPSSSSYVTAVGGTQDLANSSGAWASEQGWSGSGGGLSVLISEPSWQKGPGVSNTYSNGMRQIPDVCALADDLTPGYSIYNQGWAQFGGTSASTPLWASATLLMDEVSGHTAKGIGNMAPRVYQLNGTSVNAAFHDITVGSNATTISGGKFSCTAGWDFVTGWGSADFTKLYTALALSSSVTVSSVSLNPTTVTGGSGSTGTVTLSGAAPSGGLSVTLSSSSTSARVTSPLVIAAGKTSATFPVTTTAVTATTTATITASAGGSSQTATLTINAGSQAVNVSTLAFSPASVVGGTSSTGTVTLTGAAPTGGLKVFLSSGDASVTVPGSVMVPAASTSVTFTATTKAVTSSTPVTVTATTGATGSTSVTGTLTVVPAAAVTVSSVILNPSKVAGGGTTTGTVVLTDVAPAGGLSVTLSSSSTSATVTSPLQVAAGQSSATFTVKTTAVTTDTTATITAKANNGSASATLTIKAPAQTVKLSTLAFAPASLVGGGNSTGTLTLSGAAPAAGFTVYLWTDDGSVSVPNSVTVPAGKTSVTFTATTSVVTASTAVHVSAFSLNGTASATLTELPVALSLVKVLVNPSSVTGGSGATGTVILSGPAPAGGLSIKLARTNSTVVVMHGAVVVAAGQSSATFPIVTAKVTATVTSTITATLTGVSQTATLTVKP